MRVADNAGGECVRAPAGATSALGRTTTEIRRCRQTTAGGGKKKTDVGVGRINCERVFPARARSLSHRPERRRETTEIAADLLQGILQKHITGKGGGGGGGGEEPGGLPRLSECERKRE